MLINDEGTRGDETLEVVALSDSSWRVCDRAFATEGSGVLAYLERIDGHVSVTLVSPPPIADFVAACFSEALAIVRQRTRGPEYP